MSKCIIYSRRLLVPNIDLLLQIHPPSPSARVYDRLPHHHTPHLFPAPHTRPPPPLFCCVLVCFSFYLISFFFLFFRWFGRGPEILYLVKKIFWNIFCMFKQFQTLYCPGWPNLGQPGPLAPGWALELGQARSRQPGQDRPGRGAQRSPCLRPCRHFSYSRGIVGVTLFWNF